LHIFFVKSQALLADHPADADGPRTRPTGWEPLT